MEEVSTDLENSQFANFNQQLYSVWHAEAVGTL
jgi:hypothetical protein